jgi:hypothetical protein
VQTGVLFLEELDLLGISLVKLFCGWVENFVVLVK